MGVGIESLFTSALGLQAPWMVGKVELDTARRRIDFQLACKATRLACPHCGAANQGVHDRIEREWRHLDFFQYEAWLHAPVPRIACGACGKTTQMQVPWAREGSGFAALFEAMALALCQELPVRQAAALLRCSDKRLWRRIEHYVSAARALDDMSDVGIVGIVGIDEALPNAQISYDRFHVIAMANEAMDGVRRAQMGGQPQAVAAALGGNDRKLLKALSWGMRKNPSKWSAKQTHAMHWLQRSTLKSARAWRLKMALREVYAKAVRSNDKTKASEDLRAWISWARRSRLEPFKKLAKTLSQKFDGVVRGMLDNRSNAYVEAMNGLLQQAKRAARGFRTAANFIAIAYLRMSKLKHLPANPLLPAMPQAGVLIHRCA